MCLNDFAQNSLVFAIFCLEHSIRKIFPDHRLISWNGDNIQTVDLSKLFCFRCGGTCHPALFIKLVEEVLEGDRCRGEGFFLYGYFLLCFNCLMEAIGKTPARHYTPCKLINNQNLTVFYDIVLILVHQVIGTKCKDDAVLQFQVLRVCQILQMKETLRLLDPFRGQCDDLILFIYNKIPGFFLTLSRNEIDLGYFFQILSTYHLMRKDVTGGIDRR